MKLLAIDTATEQCSAAIVNNAAVWSKVVPTARAHADLILPMIFELLKQSNLALEHLDGLAFGRGPGSFTGVRIAASVIQGLALALDLRVVGVSNLAAVAVQVTDSYELAVGTQILVCMDARMREVYWGRFCVVDDRLVHPVGEEYVSAPDTVRVEPSEIAIGAGTGWRAYPELRAHYNEAVVYDNLLPRALDVAKLAVIEFHAGNSVSAANVQPVYLRDRVVAAMP